MATRTVTIADKNGKSVTKELIKGLYVTPAGFFEAHIKDGDKKKRVRFPLTLDGYKEAVRKIKEQQQGEKAYKEAYGGFKFPDEEERAGLVAFRNLKIKLEMKGVKVTLSEIVNYYEQFKIASESLLWGELVDRYIENRQIMYRNKPHDPLNKQMSDGIFTRIKDKQLIHEDKPIALLTKQDGENIKAILAEEYARATCNTYLKKIKQILNFGVKEGFLKSNPFNNVESFGMVGTKRQYLTADNTKEILKYLYYSKSEVSVRNFIPLTIALFCGVRNAELRRMTYSDIFNSDWSCKVDVRLEEDQTKTNIQRTFTISENCRDLINYWSQTKRNEAIKPEDYIILGETTAQRHYNLQGTIKLLRKEFNFLTKNAFRHAAASHKAQLSGDLARTAKDLGHSVQMLERVYLHAVTTEEAEEYFKIDSKIFK